RALGDTLSFMTGATIRARLVTSATVRRRAQRIDTGATAQFRTRRTGERVLGLRLAATPWERNRQEKRRQEEHRPHDGRTRSTPKQTKRGREHSLSERMRFKPSLPLE